MYSKAGEIIRKAVAGSIAALMFCGSTAVGGSNSSMCWAQGTDATGTKAAESDTATVTEVHGNVFRRPIIDNIAR
ncbi:MAG: hypothetical protein K2Z81_22370, partial [Cyanobacteria bacterium]|nr:hypothetical protein [Cyanobacteriota bacterium]